MADIHNWRRRIIPGVRSKTPEPRSSQQYFETFVDTREESRLSLAATTPTRPGRPKLRSFFSSHAPVAQVNEYEPFLADQWYFAKPPPRYEPDIEMMTRSIYKHLMSNPHGSLTPDLNSSILHVLEHCSKLTQDKQHLEERLDEEVDKQQELQRQFDVAARMWNSEKETQLAELTRLRSLVKEGRTVPGAPIERRRGTFSHPSAHPAGVSALDGQPQTLLDSRHGRGLTDIEGDRGSFKGQFLESRMVEIFTNTYASPFGFPQISSTPVHRSIKAPGC